MPVYHYVNDGGEIFGVGVSGSYYLTHHPFILSPDQDSDEDGVSDDWEHFYGLNPHSHLDANQDSDHDGYSNLAEFKLRRDPNVVEIPSSTTGQAPDLRPGIDSDGDGMPNVWEVRHGLDWEDPADAILDPDRDGFTNLEEFHLSTNPVGAPSYQVIDLPSEIAPAGANISLRGQNSTGIYGTSKIPIPTSSPTPNIMFFNRLLPQISLGSQIKETCSPTRSRKGSAPQQSIMPVPE